MAKMRAMMPRSILEKKGRTAFGVPPPRSTRFIPRSRRARLDPPYPRAPCRGGLAHGGGYTRAKAGNIGVCIGTSGPAGTDMITGLYSAIADSIPILCITGQAPRARLSRKTSRRSISSRSQNP